MKSFVCVFKASVVESLSYRRVNRTETDLLLRASKGYRFEVAEESGGGGEV